MNRLIAIGAAVLMIVGLPVFAQEAKDGASAAQTTPEVEQALLQEDWARVAELLGDVTPETPSPVKRLIKGHACLATNRNNESLELFASALNNEDRDAWQLWADAFQNDHPDNAIAWYSRGDAQARKRQWKEAEASLKEALRKQPRCFLAWNALGVVKHAVGNTILAREFFKKATQANPTFADAYASRGTLNVYLGSSSSKEHFEKAKRHSRDEESTVSLVGFGCIAYGRQDHGHARQCFDGVPQACALAPLARRNALVTEVGGLARTLRRAAEAGMPLVAFTYDVARGAQAGAANNLDNAASITSGSPVPSQPQNLLSKSSRDSGGRLPGPRPPDRRPKPPKGKPGKPGQGDPPPVPRGSPWPGPVEWVPLPGPLPLPDDTDPPVMPVPSHQAQASLGVTIWQLLTGNWEDIPGDDGGGLWPPWPPGGEEGGGGGGGGPWPPWPPGGEEGGGGGGGGPWPPWPPGGEEGGGGGGGGGPWPPWPPGGEEGGGGGGGGPWPPWPPGGEEGEKRKGVKSIAAKATIAEELLPRLPQSVVADLMERVWPGLPIPGPDLAGPDLPGGVGAQRTRKPGAAGGGTGIPNLNPTVISPRPDPPLGDDLRGPPRLPPPNMMVVEQLEAAVAAVQAARRSVEVEISARHVGFTAADAPETRRGDQRARQELGGVDADMSGIRRNGGRWVVRNVYGLLYAVPVGAEEERSAAREKTGE